ncbi:MAG: hypothetical protein JWM35_2250 [Verrucomicrobia bacterium]|nr:hypothetical protein [Verrucomicrobiota bacterium]
MAMTPIRAHLLTAFFALGIAAASHAQTNPANAPIEDSVFKDSAKSAAAADAPLPSTKLARPKRERAMSDDLAATLAVGMPKYSPPKPPEKKPIDVPADENADARDADKPKNGIIRLPDYVVRETRSPVFKDRDLATPDRKTDIGMKRYAGLNFGPFASLNRPIALAMVQEQERLDNIAELSDDARTARRAGDTATANYILKQSQQTFLRGDNSAPTYGIGK